MKNNLTTKVLSDWQKIDRDEWDNLSASPFTCYDWVKTVEESKIIPVRPYYILVYDGNKPVAFAMTYIQTEELYSTIGKALLGKFEKLVPTKLNPCLLCYSPISVTGKGIEISPEYKKKADMITDLVLEKMEKIAKTEKLKFYGFLNLSDEEKEINSVLEKDGFNKCFTCFDTYFDVDFRSFDEYVKFLSSEKRAHIKKEISRHGSSDIKTHISSEDISRFFPIMRTVQKKYNGEATIKKLEIFLPYLQKNMKTNLIALFDTKIEEMTSVAICMRFKDFFILFKSGKCDKRDSETTASYFSTNHAELLKYATDNGLKKIQFGTGSYFSKTTRGAKLKPLYLHLKSNSKVSQFYLKIIFPIINYFKLKKHLKRTKND